VESERTDRRFLRAFLFAPTRNRRGAMIRYERRADIDVDELNRLFAAAWGSPKPGYEVVFGHSFTWVGAWEGAELVGFVNVAWDGDAHFFLLDTTVHPDRRRRGIGRRLVEEAIEACRGRGEWLHVDADDELMTGFYQRCGFEPTPAGLVNLTKPVVDAPQKSRRPSK
jgi:ribosomal protein S18 acetylase RimI-like enzyme